MMMPWSGFVNLFGPTCSTTAASLTRLNSFTRFTSCCCRSLVIHWITITGSPPLQVVYLFSLFSLVLSYVGVDSTIQWIVSITLYVLLLVCFMFVNVTFDAEEGLG